MLTQPHFFVLMAVLVDFNIKIKRRLIEKRKKIDKHKMIKKKQMKKTLMFIAKIIYIDERK